MIYPPQFPRDEDNRAEKIVYEALAKLPEDNYDIYYQKTFSGAGVRESDDYEIDFLLIDKREERFNAILVIEVKGGAVSYSAKNNAWYQNKKLLDQGPDDQARKNKHNLLQRFRSIIGDVPIGWLVWFPEGYNTTGEFTPTNIRPWQVLDYDELTTPSASIETAFSEVRRKHYTYPGVAIEFYTDKLRKSLLRGLGIVQPLNILLQQYDEKFLELEKDQKAFFESLYQFDRLAVSGGAGTGKTMLAAGAAVDFANEGKSILLLCFNKMLALALETTVSGERTSVSTFHSFAYEYIYAHEPNWYDNQDDKGSEFHEFLFPAKLQETIIAHPPKEKFDVLIIDEAQDFNRFWLALTFQLIVENGKIIMFYDENQNIFGRQFEIPNEESFYRFKLPYNFRNTIKICDFVHNRTGFEIKPWKTPEGSEVDIIAYTGFEDLVNKINLILLQLVMVQKLPLEEIVILIDGSVRDHPLEGKSEIGNIPLQSWDVNSKREHGVLYFTSISRFKGLESNVVLLVKDGGEDYSEDKRFYTQCTRAKSLLKVFTNSFQHR